MGEKKEPTIFDIHPEYKSDITIEENINLDGEISTEIELTEELKELLNGEDYAKIVEDSISNTIITLAPKNIDLADKITNAKNYFIIHPEDLDDKFSEHMLEVIKEEPWIWFTNYCMMEFTPAFAEIIDAYINHKECLIGAENNKMVPMYYYTIAAYEVAIRQGNVLVIDNDYETEEVGKLWDTILDFIKRHFKIDVESVDIGKLIIIDPDTPDFNQAELSLVQNLWLANPESLTIFIDCIDNMHNYHKNMQTIYKYYNDVDKTKSCKIATSELIIKRDWEVNNHV